MMIHLTSRAKGEYDQDHIIRGIRDQKGGEMGNYITQDEEFIRARYQIDVMEAKQAHGLMIRTSFQNLIRARTVYEQAKKEADELYLATRKRLFNRLRKELSNSHIDSIAKERAERYNNECERNDPGKSGSYSSRTGNGGMERTDSTS